MPDCSGEKKRNSIANLMSSILEWKIERLVHPSRLLQVVPSYIKRTGNVRSDHLIKEHSVMKTVRLEKFLVICR